MALILITVTCLTVPVACKHVVVTIGLYADLVAREFDDLLEGNAEYRERFSLGGFDGIAHAGVCIVTCMDSRIEPLEMVGLRVGDAKILRTPGGRVTPDALVGCILGVHLLGVERILIVPHTRCAMASGEDDDIVAKVRAATGEDLTDLRIGASRDQLARLREDVELLTSHPHLSGQVTVGGFLYDVDTGELTEQLSLVT
jgi:carbonic anhydrase